jgi:hypothetical protein
MSRIKRFSDYLEVIGFDQAAVAWHLAKMEVEDHMEIVNALKGVQR